MVFLSFEFYIAVTVCLGLYYLTPVRFRFGILLAGSLGMYCCFSGRGILVLGAGILTGYLGGLALQTMRKRQVPQRDQKLCLAAGCLLALLPLLRNRFFQPAGGSLWQAIGLSYYTLQIVGYLADVYRGETPAEPNPAKYALFLSFFPQIVQGPIPRYGQLGQQLFSGNRFSQEKFSKGLRWILWGFFLKMMIADRAGVIVDTVFGNWEIYTGDYVLTAGILYSIQLYTDFMSCVFIARGTAMLFGVELGENFTRPYFSDSVREFWGRWHISLSSWLRDYIYIPLGGNRKGKVRKWINLTLVFAVSGVWHGSGYKYLAWGLLHAMYQVVGEITREGRRKLYRAARIDREELLAKILKKGSTFFLVTLAWILFRAESLRAGVQMLISLFTVRNPWIFFDDSLFSLGLDMKEAMVLLLSILLLLGVSYKQSRMKMQLGEWLGRQHLILRWGVYLAGILCIVVFGTYGYGFDAKDFIYGGF